MNEIPEHWALASLNELLGDGCLFSDGDWIESKDQDPKGENRLLQLADIGDGYFANKSSRFVNNEKFESLNCTELKEGDVLIARMPDPLGRACLMPKLSQRCLTVVDVAVFRTGKTGISSKFLMHLINSPSIRAEIELNSSGTTRKRIARGKLGELKLPIPPQGEQIRIAQKLDDLLAQVETLNTRINAIPHLLRRFRQSVLSAAISGELTKDWRFKNQNQPDLEPQNPPEEDNKILPSGWKEVNFSSVILDLRYGTAQKCEYDGGTVGVLRIPNIGESGISLSDLKSSNFKESEILKLALEEDDLVIVRSNGSVELVGRSALVTRRESGLLFAGYLIRARLDKNKALSKYVNFWIKSPVIRETIERIAKSTSGVNNINSEEIKSLTFTMPPLAEQTAIIHRIEQLFTFADQLESKANSAKSLIGNLSKSILAKAFRGELVSQDYNEEPVSDLLARIRSHQAEAPIPKNFRKPDKPKLGISMKLGKIVPVIEALSAAGTALTGQDLLKQSGYPRDASTEQMEQFFLDIRAHLISGAITKKRSKINDQDYFSLS